MDCEICQCPDLETADEIAMRACAHCAQVNGLAPMPPPQRPARACSCGGLRFIRAIPRQHSVDPDRDEPHQISTRLLLTHLPKFEKGAKPIDLRRGVGQLEVYVCAACGRVEWFCADFEAIPVHPHLMTDLVDYASGNPYR